tara:strand:+ start:37 stop:351 length:315 start_codon:yes stop_codon:yes gene_type:complete
LGNGLFKAEVIHRRRRWRSFEAVKYATLEPVDWFNNRRPLRQTQTSMLLWKDQIWPRNQDKSASGKQGAVHMSWQTVMELVANVTAQQASLTRWEPDERSKSDA